MELKRAEACKKNEQRITFLYHHVSADLTNLVQGNMHPFSRELTTFISCFCSYQGIASCGPLHIGLKVIHKDYMTLFSEAV